MARNSSSSISPLAGWLRGEEFYDAPKSVHRLFEEMLHSSNEKTALIYKDGAFPLRGTSYKELNRNANKMAHLLLDTIKISPFAPNQDGDFVIGVIAKASDTLVTIVLAIMKTGAAYMPIDPRFPRNRVEHILNVSKPLMIIYDDKYPHADLLESFLALKVSILERESFIMSSQNILDDEAFTKENSTQKALICFTSGSTGAMKGVRLSHFTLFHRISLQLIAYPFVDSEVNCVFRTSISFIDHVSELWCPLVSSKTVIVVPHEVADDPERLICLLQDNHVQRILLVPSLLRGILTKLRETRGKAISLLDEATRKTFPLSNLRLWISSGEELTADVAQQFFSYYSGVESLLVNCYGTTEALDCLTYELTSMKPVEKLSRIPLGLPVLNTIVYIVSRDTKRLVADEDIGEICVSGMTLTDGFVSAAESNAFRQNEFSSSEMYQRIFHTGDYGYIKNGLVYFEGRDDAQINVNGIRINLGEITSIVSDLACVAACTTLVYHPSQPDQTILAVVVLKNSFNTTTEEILGQLSSSLVDYMMPTVYITDEIPRLASGKADQHSLLFEYEDSLPKEKVKVNVEYDLNNIPKNRFKVARKVFQAIGEALGHDFHARLTADCNFFRLGGTSLHVIPTVYELCTQDCNITVNEFLTAKTIGEIIGRVSEDKKVESLRVTSDMKFIREPLNAMETHKCIDLLSTSYGEKMILNRFVADIKVEDYQNLLKLNWHHFFNGTLSFMVKNQYDAVIGVTLLADIDHKPKDFPINAAKEIFDFINDTESSVMEHVLGTCLYVFMMGTAFHSLEPRTNFALVNFMETEIIEVAIRNKFNGILVTNFDPMTQHIERERFGYETLLSKPIKRYQSKEGTRPFNEAPIEQCIEIMYRKI